ncbi:MAG TPA: hypothetical protein VGM88_14935 [Kofleriaceae bacterium]|jgi:hypothetical protein
MRSLLIQLRQPRSRARELIELHDRLRAELGSRPDPEEVALAASVLAQKRAVAALQAGVTSCSSCATGRPLPDGRFDGGACCSGSTEILFDDDELGALVHAGTRIADLPAPRTDHAGCAFRGATGCTLSTTHRPARCVHYLCDGLRAELHRRGALDDLEVALAELDRRMQAFRAARAARTDRQVLEPLLDALRRKI